jgi:phosphatidylglycerophosphate synthase
MLGTPRAPSRRPLKTRGKAWARTLASLLARRGIQPNWISLFSLLPATGAGASFLLLPHASRDLQILLLLLAAACIQLRLLANMVDGLVAIEGGRHTATGDLFNEVPDRIADVLILAPAGYAIAGVGAWGIALGWTVAVLAVLTAYIRVFGGSLGFEQSFVGPMAKPHRMGALTITCAASAIEVAFVGFAGRLLFVGLVLIGVGTGATCVRRLRLIAGELEARPVR